ncbi:hypothetical protein VZT92_004571 [Zoarces viviparus]
MSHILQPLDVSFFGPLKADFSGVTEELSAVSHSFLVYKEFSRVLRDSYQRVKDRTLVVAGFRRCGLSPVDPMAIDWSRVMPIPYPQNQPPSAPPPNPYITHPLVTSGQITVDLAHLLAEINYIVEDRDARQEAQALARRDREQQRAGDTGPAATFSTLSGAPPKPQKTSVPLGCFSHQLWTFHHRSLIPLCLLLCLPLSPAACQQDHNITTEPAC